MTTLHVEITFIKPRWKRLFVCIFSFVCFFLCCYVFSLSRTQYIFYTPMARYRLFLLKLKVLLNTNKPNQTNLHMVICLEHSHKSSYGLEIILYYSLSVPSRPLRILLDVV